MDYYKKYIKYKNKYKILCEHLGGGTNNFFRILQNNNITNGQELNNNFNFYTLFTHGTPNNRWFTVPNNTYILFKTNATLAAVTCIWGGREGTSEFSKFMYQKPENNTDQDWYNSIYSEIEQGTFFQKLLYKDSMVTAESNDVEKPITSIYEPGDIIQDLDLFFNDRDLRTNLWGVWKNPISKELGTKLYEINTPYVKCREELIHDTKIFLEYLDIDSRIFIHDDLYKTISNAINELKSQFKDIFSLIKNGFSLKNIDTLFDRINADMDKISKNYKGEYTENMKQIIDSVTTFLPRIRKNIECLEKIRLTVREVEQREITSNEKQLIDKVIVKDGLSIIPIPRGKPRISYSSGLNGLGGSVRLYEVVNQIDTYQSIDNKPFKFIAVDACRIETDEKKKILQRRMSIGVRDTDTVGFRYNIPYLKSIGVDDSKLFELERDGYDIDYLDKFIRDSKYKRGDLVFICNIHPMLNGRTGMLKNKTNENGQDGFIISLKYNKHGREIDVEFFIKLKNITRNYDSFIEEEDMNEYIRINNIIESNCYQ